MCWVRRQDSPSYSSLIPLQNAHSSHLPRLRAHPRGGTLDRCESDVNDVQAAQSKASLSYSRLQVSPSEAHKALDGLDEEAFLFEQRCFRMFEDNVIPLKDGGKKNRELLHGNVSTDTSAGTM